jgi:hypothetical protein
MHEYANSMTIPLAPRSGGRPRLVLADAPTRRVTVHKIASATCGRIAAHQVEVGPGGPARPGDVVVVEALEEKRVYDQLELIGGRLAHVSPGDVIAGTLGDRYALRGFVGHCPDTVQVGDILHVLNLGGVIGVATSANEDLGKPLRVRVIGFAQRRGCVVNIRDGAVPAADRLDHRLPVVVVAGTCMAAGKTRAACEITAGLTQRGLPVGGVKLSGVAALRDTLNMEDHGAVRALSFLDAGRPSTVGLGDVAQMAKGLLNAVAAAGARVIVVEMGDGIIGGYGVASFYADTELRAAITVHVMCANDLVAAWGATELARSALRRPVDVMCGPATDNEVGVRYVEQDLGVAAVNARTAPARLVDLVAARCGVTAGR